jgi:hypothetical protein
MLRTLIAGVEVHLPAFPGRRHDEADCMRTQGRIAWRKRKIKTDPALQSH